MRLLDFLASPSEGFTAGLGHGYWYMSLIFLLNNHQVFIPSPVLPNSANAFPDAVNGQNPT
jgi:hypothetical protein